MDHHLPFHVEYAKSSKSRCRICEEMIGANVLRISIAVRVIINNVIKMNDHWYHEECFFKKYSPESTRKIANFDNIRPDDQKRIKEKINGKRATASTSNEDGDRKRRNGDAFPIADFKAEYAKLDYLECHDCENVITLGEIRLSKKDHKNGLDHWYHLRCFAKLRFELQFFDEGTNISGLTSLSIKDQDEVKKALPKIEEENIPPQAKRIKPEPVDDKHEENLDNQQEELFFIRDKLQCLQDSDLIKMLKENRQGVPENHRKIIDALSDVMAFGALELCPKCKGYFTFKSDGMGYRCNDAFPWASCGNVALYPKRKEFIVPENLKIMNHFLGKYQPRVKDRLLSTPPSDGKKKLRIKGGGTVIPASNLDDIAHVFQRKNKKFTATLVKVHTQTKTNEFYNMQILEHDKQEEYWLFCEWGQIGTDTAHKLCKGMALEECIHKFERLFEEKTGNPWSGHAAYSKNHGMYHPIYDGDDDDDENFVGLLSWKPISKLKKPIQDLVRVIFGSELMKKAMLEYEIDMDKMPLGKISKKRIHYARSVLSKLTKLVLIQSQDRTKFIEASNEFYTLIPHNFGDDGPNIIETAEEIQRKEEMLKSLSKMITKTDYTLLQRDADKNPLDTYYEQLKTDIDVLRRDSDEYKIIETYVKNTHAKRHSYYKIAIEEIFIVNRSGEESRFEPYKNFQNRKLLWHGSDVTNFAQILSQGLKYAPFGAPVTGHRLGKGIYFADMVSNAAYYCKTSNKSTGLLLLCDVALGKMYESKADDDKPADDGYDSIWARGKTQPDPQESTKLKTGVVVPYGPEIPAETKKHFSLQHNAFVVNNEAQVKLEYIVKLKFEYEDALQ